MANLLMVADELESGVAVSIACGRLRVRPLPFHHGWLPVAMLSLPQQRDASARGGPSHSGNRLGRAALTVTGTGDY